MYNTESFLSFQLLAVLCNNGSILKSEGESAAPRHSAPQPVAGRQDEYSQINTRVPRGG